MRRISHDVLAPIVLVIPLLVATACAPQTEEGAPPPQAEETDEEAAIPVGPPEFCAQAPHDQLCSFLPHDVIADFDLAGYSQIGAATQRPFDNFSWQSFVALNWPADADGTPLAGPIGTDPGAPRVWMSYDTTLDVFGPDAAEGRAASADACAGVAEGKDLPLFHLMAKSDHVDHAKAAAGIDTESFLESTGQPLIDRDLNFVLYDVRMNPVEVSYIRDNGLDTAAGQTKFKDDGKTVSFEPLGHYDDPSTRTGGTVGSIEIKTSWRILKDEGTGPDDPSRYYTTEGLVFVPAANSESGEPFCFAARLALVGFHVIQRTQGPKLQTEPDWMWSTFEHADNAPLATNAGDPAGFDPGPDVCQPPADAGDHSFYNPACTGCAPNTAPALKPGETDYKWSTSPPYAERYAVDGEYGTQVVRCWSIFPETAELNGAFRAKLPAPWNNYYLVNTQWQGGVEDPQTENGNLPRYLANSTLETYIQSTSSCLECHAFAKTSAGQDANFSFLLGIP